MSILTIEKLTFSYGNRSILEAVDFELEEQDVVALIGPNGGGKSTLLKLILGLLTPKSGTIKLFGRPPKESRNQVGYLPQYVQVDLDYPINVEDTLLLALMQGNPFFHPNKKDREKVSVVLDQCGITSLIHRPIADLSGGERQRVFLARALINKPKLLILDEPTANIDLPAAKNLYELIDDLQKQMAIVIVSHDISAVSSVVKRIACLNKKMTCHHRNDIDKDDLNKVYGHDIDLISHSHNDSSGHHHD